MYASAHMWKSEDKLQELALSFHHVSPGTISRFASTKDVIIMADGNLGWETWRQEEDEELQQISRSLNVEMEGDKVLIWGDNYSLRFILRVKSGPNIIYS